MVSCPGLLAFALVAVANSRKISPKELQRREQRKREREGLRGPAAEQALQDTARTQASPALRLETQRAELEERLAELETQGAALAAETARVEHGIADVLEALDRANGTDAATAPPPAAAPPPATSPAACAAPPAGGNATVVRFGAVDESGLRVAGRGWGRVLAKWRCAKRMKIAVLGGSMTCGGNLAKSDKDKKGKAWPSQLLAKLRSSLGAGVSLHNACVPASSLGWCVSLLSTRVLAGTDVVVVDYSQNDNRPTIEDAREGGAAVDASVRRVAEAFLVALVRGLRRRRAELEDAREGLGRRDRLAQRDLAPGRVPRRRQAVQGQVPELPHGVEPRRRQSEAGPGGPGQVQAPFRLRVLGSLRRPRSKARARTTRPARGPASG